MKDRRRSGLFARGHLRLASLCPIERGRDEAQEGQDKQRDPPMRYETSLVRVNRATMANMDASPPDAAIKNETFG